MNIGDRSANCTDDTKRPAGRRLAESSRAFTTLRRVLARDRAASRHRAYRHRVRDAFNRFAALISEREIDELIRTQSKARNIFTSLERATDEELDELELEFRKLRARTVARRAAKATAGQK